MSNTKPITKTLVSYTIDIEINKKFDEIVPNNNKSKVIEEFQRQFIESNPRPISTMPAIYWQSEKSGVQYR